MGAWSHDGSLLGYSSTRRNGTDSDLYVVDPRNPSSGRMVAQVSGGGWGIADFSPDNRRAVVVEYKQITKSNLYMLDVASGALTPIGDHAQEIAYGGAQFARDGQLWVTSDEGSDFQRLGTIDPASGRFTAAVTDIPWDVDSFDISEDGRFIAFVINEAGASKLRVLDTRTRRSRLVSALPTGVIGGVEIAPWGAIGFSLTSARSAADAYSVDLRTLAVTRWTRSETGGLDTTVNAEPELIDARSFDGERVYRLPLPARRPALPGPPAADRQHPRRARSPVAAWLPRPQQLSAQRARHRHFLSQRARLDRASASASSASTTARRFARTASAISAPSSTASARTPRSTRPGSRSPAAPMAAICATPRRSIMASRLRAANCVVAISNFVTFLENTQSYRRDLRRVEYGDEREPARRIAADQPDDPRVRASYSADGGDRRQRSARAAIGGRPDGRRGARRRTARLAPDRPERGSWLRQEGEPGLSIPGRA